MSNLVPYVLDVRPILSGGEEPFSHIQEAVRKLLPGQALLLKAPFEPYPLYHFMKQQGYDAFPQEGASGQWEILFTPGEKQETAEEVLDLRDLEPPEPMQKALEAAALLGRTDSLAIRTRFRPVHLLDRLETLGYIAESEECGPNNWETHIWRTCDHT